MNWPKHYLLLASILVVISCNLDDENNNHSVGNSNLTQFQIDSTSYCSLDFNSPIVPFPSSKPGFKIQTTTTSYSNLSYDFIDSFLYDNTTGLIDRIINFRQDTITMFLTYENELLTKISYLNSIEITNGEIYRIDSLIYNSNGQLITYIENRKRNDGLFSASKSEEYSYNIDRLTHSQYYYYSATGEKRLGGSNIYCWENQNLTREVNYLDDGQKAIEQVYDYDDKVNYKKGIPQNFQFPSFWSLNNQTKTTLNEYLIAVEPLCGTICEFSADYNSNDLPISIDSQNGTIQTRIVYQ